MNPPPLRLLAIGTVVIAALLSWQWLRLKPGDSTRLANAAPAREARLLGSVQTTSAWPALGTPELRDRLREPAARWLDSRERDAVGLIAIWDLCGDRDLLEEAARRFPDHPRVCRTMIEANSGDMATVLPWIERLIATDPFDPDGYYLKAWALFTTGRDDEALTAIRNRTSFTLFDEVRFFNRSFFVREAATALGLPARDAALASIAFLRGEDLCRRSYDRIHRSLTTLIDQALAANDTATAASLGHIVIAPTTQPQRGYGSPPLLSEQIFANGYAYSILNRFPDDSVWDYFGITTAEWKDHATRATTRLVNDSARAHLAAQLLAAAPDEVVIQYSRHFFSAGEIAANDWLLDDLEPASQ